MIQISDPVINHITFGTDDAARAAFQHMLHEVQAEGQPLGSIDFNKLIPMPEALAIRAGFQTDQGLKLYSSFIEESTAIVKATLFMPETKCSEIVTKHLAKWDAVKKKDPETWTLGEKAFQNIKKYGFPTWVEWARMNWGTRDNACFCVPLDHDSDTMVFQTMRTAVPKLAAALSKKYPGQTITYSWAEDGQKEAAGRMVFQGGKAVEIHVSPGCEAHAMSAGVWRFQADMEGSCHARDQKKNGRRMVER